ncbi:MAG TPA: tetratricopeptide repeat protein [Phycisphaerae bacterium]|nr:tetratricopeptide repeat protein [Phycisphaerae bacterium]HNU45574.1 tetratricopeptide repeat protein [Phycisphaerae bacterium]
MPGWPARWLRLLVPALVGLASFAAFYPALHADFVNLDDDRLFVSNTAYQGLDSTHLRWMFTTTFMGHYQPLTWLSAAVDHYLSGPQPSSYHRNNLILHALNGVLLYFVALRLLRAARPDETAQMPVASRLAAAAAALLFAVHPLRVESVAWASERRDVLSTLFLLLALLLYLRAVRPGAAALRSRPALVLCCTLLLLSLLCKAWGMSFVVITVVLDVYPLRRLPARLRDWFAPAYRTLWAQKIPLVVLGVAAAVMAGIAQRSAVDTMRSLAEWGLLDRIVQACFGLAFYIGKTLWPTHLGPAYDLPYQLDPLRAVYVLTYVAVPAAAVLLVRYHRRVPALAAAAVVYVVTVAPVLGFAQSGPQFVAERYSYVSCMGWPIVAAGGLLHLWHRAARKRPLVSARTDDGSHGAPLSPGGEDTANGDAVPARPSPGPLRAGAAVALFIPALVLVTLALTTWHQTKVWHDSRTLWAHVLSLPRPSAGAHLNYGILLNREGRTADAIASYRQALQVQPHHGEAWFALANALKQQKNFEEAERAYLKAAQHMAYKHSAYLNLGNMYYNDLKRRDDAIAAYRNAIQYIESRGPKMFSPKPYLALGLALREKGEFAEARTMLTKAAAYAETRDRARRELARLPGGR